MEQKTESYYKAPKDNIAFERCIEVMSRLIMKYGSGLLKKMDQEKLKSLISAEIESGTDKARFSTFHALPQERKCDILVLWQCVEAKSWI